MDHSTVCLSSSAPAYCEKSTPDNPQVLMAVISARLPLPFLVVGDCFVEMGRCDHGRQDESILGQ